MTDDTRRIDVSPRGDYDAKYASALLDDLMSAVHAAAMARGDLLINESLTALGITMASLLAVIPELEIHRSYARLLMT